MYEKDHIAESLNAFDIILPHIVSNNIEFSLLVDKTKNENTSELYVNTFQNLVESEEKKIQI